MPFETLPYRIGRRLPWCSAATRSLAILVGFVASAGGLDVLHDAGPSESRTRMPTFTAGVVVCAALLRAG